VKKITSVLVVDSVEAQLPFWEERLGFARVASVPHGDTLGFVILVAGGAELMIQSRASVAADVASVAEDALRAYLYVEVASLADVEARLRDWPVEVARRTTFYGAHEVGVRDPAGNFVLFSERVG
jgi:uncharacterized glyoxalase superfamily protein PhnB